MMADSESINQELLELEDRIHQQLTSELEMKLDSSAEDGLPNVAELQQHVEGLIDKETYILTQDQRSNLTESVINRVIGLGPLEPLLNDPSITEIMVNDPFNVFIEREGQIEAVDVTFRDESHLRHVIDRIVAPIGRRIDESSPLVDARLPDGSRVNAIIPPLAIAGPALTIRKFGREPFTLEKLVSLGTIDVAIAQFLQSCVEKRMSIIISGGTGSGKTTTLNALGLCIPPGERLITIEDSAELRLEYPHLVSLESRPPNIEGEGEIPIRMLVRNALRMRPDRIIVGEVRGGEAFDMLQAMNTGHRGSLTTLHANTPTDALIRLESMVLMAGFDMPVSAIRRMITGAVEIIIQQDRLSDGRRVITAICEMAGKSADDLTLELLFQYDPDNGKYAHPGTPLPIRSR
jgi:pilus assembly protein CpaF